MPEPVHLVFGVGKTERTAAMPGDGLAGLGFERARIEADIVIDASAEPEARCRMGDLAGGVPGGARGQLGLLQQHDVPPAFMGEVIGNPASHDAAADNNDAGL